MENILEYAILGGVVIIFVLMIVFFTRLSAVEREVRESRRETAQTLSQNYAAVNQALSDSELATGQRLEYLRSSVEGRLADIRDDNHRQLERMRQTVDEKLQSSLDEKLSRSFASVRQSLQEVYR